jgi:hypothetical protein
MFENDYRIIDDYFNRLSRCTTAGGDINQQLRETILNNQMRCRHMYPDETDAIYYAGHGRNKCAICGKEF